MSKRLFVQFLSPGTFFSEVTEKQVHSFDVAEAKRMAKDIVERYGAKPYGFRFLTKELTGDSWDQKTKTTYEPGMYYLGGNVVSYEQVVARNRPDESILRNNMRYNDYTHIIENFNSYKSVLPFNPEIDKVV